MAATIIGKWDNPKEIKLVDFHIHDPHEFIGETPTTNHKRFCLGFNLRVQLKFQTVGHVWPFVGLISTFPTSEICEC